MVSDGVRFFAGLGVSAVSIVGMRFAQARLGLAIPYQELLLLAVVAVVPAVICRRSLLSLTSSLTGVLVGLMVWFIALPLEPAFWPYDLLSSWLGSVPLVALLLVMMLAGLASGLFGMIIRGEEEVVTPPSTTEKEEGQVPSQEPQLVQPTGPETPEQVIGPADVGEGKELQRIEEVLLSEQETMYIICRFCSEPVPEGAKFCPHCGKKV